MTASSGGKGSDDAMAAIGDDHTDWPQYARDFLSGDPEKMKTHLPDWMRDESSEPPATCDGCGKRAWCSLTSWREAGVVVGKFLCDNCRQTIPNDERGWGHDANA